MKLSLILAGLTALSAPAFADDFNPYQCEGNATFVVEPNKANMTTLRYFGTSVSVQIYGQAAEVSQKALCDALNVVQEYHYQASNYSTYPDFTNIKTINNAPDQTHIIDSKLMDLLEASLEWHDKTGGRFNVALSPVVDIWRGYRKRCQQGGECETPKSSELEQAARLTNVDNIKLDAVAGTISMAPGMSLDLGGIAKGWMVEKVYDSLKNNGVQQFIINAGGNIRHYGLHPDGREFVTGIENPVCRKNEYSTPECQMPENHYHELISGKNLTVVSSGNYLNYYTVDGQEYHHIIDPSTLAPNPDGIAVTVVMEDQQIIADVLSTSLFLMPRNEALELLKTLPGTQAVWYENADGSKWSTSDFDKFRLKLP